MGLENPKGNVRYLAFSLDTDGRPRITLKTISLEYTSELPAGYAEIETLQAGVCSSEVLYYLRLSPGTLSRFEQDYKDVAKQEYYLQRNMSAGIVSRRENSAKFRDLLRRSMFHEATCRITRVHPMVQLEKIPVQTYVPSRGATGDIGFVKEIIETNFQERFAMGGLTVRNPIFLCATHSRADNLNPETGWPTQCHRGSEGGHTPKGAMGHMECIGAAIDGPIRVSLDTLTPLPITLQRFVEEDITKRACLLTAIEPLGCIFDAFGTMLQTNESPDSIVVVGDGWSSLNAVAFLQVLAPRSKVILVGKHLEKLRGIQKINPETIDTVLITTEDYSELGDALRQINARGQCDVIMATVPLQEHIISHFVRDAGMIIWWAARISAFAQGKMAPKRYRERFPFGGAPRSEISAAALIDYFIRERPEVAAAFVSYPGTYYTLMGKAAARDIQEWLENEGRLRREIVTSEGLMSMSVRPIINMAGLNAGVQ